jgi:type II secretory pathway pseudopilin PulG
MNAVLSIPFPDRCGRRTKRGHRAFSRTDLLVSLAVLSVLLALAVVSHRALRGKQQLAVCTDNLRQIGRAVLLYSSEHGERLPDRPLPQPGDLWWWYKEMVKQYAGLTGASSDKDTLFACPLDRGYSDPRPFSKSARFDYTSYVLNGVQLPGVPSIAGLKTAAIAQPDRTLLVMEWTAHAPLSWHQSRTGRANAPFYSDALNVVGFVDGHVQFTRIYYDGYNPAFTRDPIPGYDYKFSGN